MQIQKTPTNKQNEKTTTKNNQTKIEIKQTNIQTNREKTNNQTKIEIILFAGGSQTWFVFKFICHQMKTTVNSLSDRGSIAIHFDPIQYGEGRIHLFTNVIDPFLGGFHYIITSR